MNAMGFHSQLTDRKTAHLLSGADPFEEPRD